MFCKTVRIIDLQDVRSVLSVSYLLSMVYVLLFMFFKIYLRTYTMFGNHRVDFDMLFPNRVMVCVSMDLWGIPCSPIMICI